MKKVLALLLALTLMASALVGCGGDEQNVSTGEISDVAVNELADTVEDSSDLPDWTGKTIELTKWYASGSYAINRNNQATNDVVADEVFRVTGVRFADDSFDNNGDTMDAKISKIIATDGWPEVIWGGQTNVTSQLIEEDLLWDLTELIPEYMPHLHALMQKGSFMKSKRADGKIYAIDLNPSISYAYPDMDPELLARFAHPKADTGYVLVRDDILKQLKPEAFTQKELLQKFEENGTFTEEEILNASFNSKEEFYQFLRDIKALGLKVGNREVYATYAFAGSDNWDFLSVLAGALEGYNTFVGTQNNYFTYFDMETGRVEYMFKQPFFKELVKELAQLVQEDVIAQDSLVDNRAAYEEKCATGQYAILYGGTCPDVNTLNANAEGYQYRKVIINIPYNTDKFVPMANEIGGSYTYAFMKNQIAEEDLPQVLRFFDFMLTEVGQKLQMWGPRSAGLFEETENGRRFVNKDVEAEAVMGVTNDSLLYYGLQDKAWPGVPTTVNRWNPVYIYDFTPGESSLNKFYSTGIFNPQERVHGTAPNIYSFTGSIEGAKKVWDARSSFESALTKVFISKDEAEFETLYNEFVAVAERNGLTDETLEEINTKWATATNKDNMELLDNYMKSKGKKLNIEY